MEGSIAKVPNEPRAVLTPFLFISAIGVFQQSTSAWDLSPNGQICRLVQPFSGNTP